MNKNRIRVQLMPKLTVDGATLICSKGTAPCILKVPIPLVQGENHPVATIQDRIPGMNIPGFTLCTATGDPKPCAPSFPGPWAPGAPTVLVHGIPALQHTDTLTCAQGGVVSITYPGQTMADL